MMTIYFSEADDSLYNLINGQEVNYHWQNYAFSFKKELLNDNENSFGISIVPTLEYWRHSSGSKDSKSIYNQQDSLDGKDQFDNFIGSLSLPISKKLSEAGADLIKSSIDKCINNPLDIIEQDDSMATFAPKISKEDLKIFQNLDKKFIFICLIRGLCFTGVNVFFFIAVINMKYAIAMTLTFASPFFVALMSIIILKDKVGIFRWSAIFIGFAGVLMIMKPTSDVFTFYSIFPILVAFLWSLSMIVLRFVPENVSTAKIQFYSLFFSILGAYVLGARRCCKECTFQNIVWQYYKYVLHTFISLCTACLILLNMMIIHTIHNMMCIPKNYSEK